VVVIEVAAAAVTALVVAYRIVWRRR